MADHDKTSEPHGAGMRTMYIVWAWLLALTALEVFLAYLQVPLLVMLLSLIGLSMVKAALIVAYFMHMKFERLNLVLTIMGSASTEFVTHYASENARDSARNNAELMSKAEAAGAALV